MLFLSWISDKPRYSIVYQNAVWIILCLIKIRMRGHYENIDIDNSSQETLQFAHHYAFVIGIDAYEKVSALTTAVNDAKKLLKY